MPKYRFVEGDSKLTYGTGLSVMGATISIIRYKEIKRRYEDALKLNVALKKELEDLQKQYDVIHTKRPSINEAFDINSGLTAASLVPIVGATMYTNRIRAKLEAIEDENETLKSKIDLLKIELAVIKRTKFKESIFDAFSDKRKRNDYSIHYIEETDELQKVDYDWSLDRIETLYNSIYQRNRDNPRFSCFCIRRTCESKSGTECYVFVKSMKPTSPTDHDSVYSCVTYIKFKNDSGFVITKFTDDSVDIEKYLSKTTNPKDRLKALVKLYLERSDNILDGYDLDEEDIPYNWSIYKTVGLKI